MTDLEVPVVDLVNGTPDALTDALMTSSCAFVTGHGVPAAVRNDLVGASREFFDLPVADKARVQWPGDGLWRGWQPLADGQVVLEEGAAPDLLERFEVQLTTGSGTSDADLLRRSDRFGLWPASPEGFRLAWVRYYAALAGLATRVVSSIAASLDLPVEDLADWCEDQHGNLVVNNYLAQTNPPPAADLRQKAHTDIGGLTILWADAAPGGLEVRAPGVHGWSSVEFPDDVFLVQAGDLLARWTNQKIRANVHRVANPPAGLGGTSRRVSVVYFHYPKLDTVVAPAPSCVGEGGRVAGSIDARAHLLDAVTDPAGRYARMDAALSET